MEIRFKNIIFDYTEDLSRDDTGVFTATVNRKDFYEAADKYDHFSYYRSEKTKEIFAKEKEISFCGINQLIIYLYHCMYFKSEQIHKIKIKSNSIFFIIHDAFHAFTDIRYYDDVKNVEPFWRMNCSGDCEKNQLLRTCEFMIENDIEISDEYLEKVEQVYRNQNNGKPLEIIAFKQMLLRINNN